MTPEKTPPRMPLTRAQRRELKQIKAAKGAFIIPHVKPNGNTCYRLMTEDMSPVRNIRTGLVERLLQKCYLQKKGAILSLS